MASEAEVVAEGNVHFGFASDVWHVVEIALGIGLVEVDGRWDDAVFHRHQASGDFDATCCTKKVTSHGFRRAHDQAVFSVISEGSLDRFGFADVAETGGGAVGVDVADFIRVDLAMLEGHGHAARSAFTFGVGRGHVIGIGAESVANEFGVNVGTAFFGVLQFLDHQNAGTFAHDETIASDIEGARSALWFVIARAECFHVAETAESAGENASFAAAAEEGIGIAEFDDAPSLTDRVVGGGTGCDDGHVRSTEAVFHGNDAAGDVGNHHRNEERRNATGATIDELGMLFFEGAEATDTRADHDTDLIFIDLLGIEAGINECHACGGDSELHVAVGAAAVLGVVEKRGCVEIFHLTGNVRGVGGGVHAGDTVNAAAASFHGFPCALQIVAEWADAANPCNHYASFVHWIKWGDVPDRSYTLNAAGASPSVVFFVSAGVGTGDHNADNRRFWLCFGFPKW